LLSPLFVVLVAQLGSQVALISLTPTQEYRYLDNLGCFVKLFCAFSLFLFLLCSVDYSLVSPTANALLISWYIDKQLWAYCFVRFALSNNALSFSTVCIPLLICHTVPFVLRSGFPDPKILPDPPKKIKPEQRG